MTQLLLFKKAELTLMEQLKRIQPYLKAKALLETAKYPCESRNISGIDEVRLGGGGLAGLR